MSSWPSSWVSLRGKSPKRTALLISVLLVCAAIGSAAPTPAPPAEARSLLREAEQLLDSGAYEQARTVLQQVTVLAPDWLRPRGCLGGACQALGERGAALASYRAMQKGSLLGPPEPVDVVAGYGAEVLWLVNSERLAQGIRPLKPHPMVSLVAQRHSEEMRDLGYFSHDSPRTEHQTPTERFAEIFGFQPRLIAENIARRYGFGLFSLTMDNLRASHRDLMGSPGHRGNILDREYTDLGVGLSTNRSGDFWLTEVFVRFR